MKNKTTAYLLWLISGLGWLGFHQHYLGKHLKGLLYPFTGGLFVIGAVLDLFTLGSQVEQYNTNEELKTIRANAMSSTSNTN